MRFIARIFHRAPTIRIAGNASPDFFEAMTSLAYLAGLVRKVRLGIACVVVPCRNPLLAAKQIATLDVLCDGRLDIGVGIGSPSTIKSREYEVLGVNRKAARQDRRRSPARDENDLDESSGELRRTVRQI